MCPPHGIQGQKSPNLRVFQFLLLPFWYWTPEKEKVKFEKNLKKTNHFGCDALVVEEQSKRNKLIFFTLKIKKIKSKEKKI